jgi:ATP-dependent DNA helicase RecG
MHPDPDYLRSLVQELRGTPSETGWLEFKENFDNHQEIGEYISALSNSAALDGKARAYLVWGVRDGDHEIVGTRFDPSTAKVGAEELENWLLRLLSPKIDFAFYPLEIAGKRVVVFEIDRAIRHPVQFQGVEYIRIGSYKKKLKDFPEKARILWRVLDETPFERLFAVERVTGADVIELLDFPAYFNLMGLPIPAGADGIIAALSAERLIERLEGNRWNVFNVSAILFARKFSDFSRLQRKAVRVIAYQGVGRAGVESREQVGALGYAAGFNGLIDYINNLLPRNEIIKQVFRETAPTYPKLAIRELVANAIIHQDFSISGAGPTVEIFNDRLEITNPGKPLVDPQRFLDLPPRSRNEQLASLMRRMKFCEERGSGIDRVVAETEKFQLPAPVFETVGESTRSTLFAHRPLNKMESSDRVKAVYLHACLKFVERDFMTNASIRGRFGIEEGNSAQASRIIKEALIANQVRLHDPNAAPKYRKYVPHWA